MVRQPVLVQPSCRVFDALAFSDVTRTSWWQFRLTTWPEGMLMTNNALKIAKSHQEAIDFGPHLFYSFLIRAEDGILDWTVRCLFLGFSRFEAKRNANAVFLQDSNCKMADTLNTSKNKGPWRSNTDFMAAWLTGLTQKTVTLTHLVAESVTRRLTRYVK